MYLVVIVTVPLGACVRVDKTLGSLVPCDSGREDLKKTKIFGHVLRQNVAGYHDAQRGDAY